ncbi:MAG: hypothetical protein WC827_03015 [Candidatus Paceibacterota bacterium]|jgi:hypothetical protein
MNDGQKVTISICVRDSNGRIARHKFNFMVYRVTIDNLFLGRDFYKRHGKIPGAMHHEIEILDTDTSRFHNPDMFYYNKSIVNNKPFIFYPFPIPTITLVFEIINICCLTAAFDIRGVIPIFNEPPKTTQKQLLVV